MGKKGKGLSFDQKKQKMLAIFHSTKDVYNYNDIQKASTKVGIPFPSVKQVLKSLQADGLVQCEKIGAGVFYWSFPSKSVQIMNTRIEQTQNQIAIYEQQNQRYTKQIKQAQPGREDTQQRAKIIQEINSFKIQKQKLNTEIQKYIRFDPQRVDLLKKQNINLKKLVNNETDNLEQIKKFIKKSTPGIKDDQIEQAYEIPSDIDYID